MKFHQQIIALLSLLSFAHACIVLEGTYYITGAHPNTISATLTDNGKRTCTFSGNVNADHYFANCIPTFASYIYKDMSKLAYSNNGAEYLLDVTKTSDLNPFESYYRLSLRAFC
jgi:hypothetical protein